MTVWDLSRLRYTVRKITGQFDENQLPSASPGAGQVSVNNPPGVDDYLNDFYLFDMPEHMRTLKLKDFYTFTTIPNVGTYNLGQTFYQVRDPIYIDNYQFAFYEDPNIFYRIWPEFNFIDQAIATTDGTSTTYTFTVTQNPVQQGTVVIGIQPNVDANPSPQLETLVDQDTPALLDQPTQIMFTNPGTLTGNLGGTGTVDYLSGAVSVTFATPPPAGLNINAHYHPYAASRPRDIMYFQNQLFLRPIPNDTYSVKLIVYKQPTVAISDLSNATQKSQFDGTLTDVALFNEWWQMMAYGAALKIMIQEGDHEEYARHKPYFEEAKLLAQRRALKDLASQRINTNYSEMAGAPSFPVFPIY